MEVTDENLATLANYLQQTLNPDTNVRRPAEKFLESVEVNQNYAILVLHLIDKETVDLTIRVAAAIAFKNFIKRNWPIDEDGVNRIHASDRNTIKTLIVSLMLKSPEAIQRQFSDAVSIIGKCDFPENWPSLIPEMVEKFNTGDFHVINGVLRTAHSLFKRYRYEFKSQKLWEEIKHVLENFAKPLTDLFVATIDLTTKHADNPQALRVIYGSLVLICKVFYSLNYQDLPEFFEDNMPIWMPNLLNLLQDDDETPGVMEQLRTEICECAALYALKYEEEFAPHAPAFVTCVWTVLLATGPQAKYDALVSNALTFLAKIAEKNNYKSLFEDPATLSSICEKVVIPNMEFRGLSDSAEYVRRDIEGSDVDTRRRAACDLVRTLAQHYEDKMMNIFGQYVQLMLAKYGEMGAAAWRGKDAAMYLVTSLASRGSTQAAGVTRASPLVDLAQFAQTHVLPELQRTDAVTSREPRPSWTWHSSPRHTSCPSCRGLTVSVILSCSCDVTRASPLVDLAQFAQTHVLPELQRTDAILRTLSCLQDGCLTYLGDALPKLAHMLSFCFVAEFMPYVFQMLSLLLELRGGGAGGAGGGGEAYGALLPCVVAPALWERPANVRPLVRLLCAFVAHRTQLVLDSGRLNAMLGVFQKLIASKTNDHEGFYLIQTMLYKFGNDVMGQYTKQIITLLFQRLSSSKTTKYVRGLIAFLGFYAVHFGADPLIDLVESVQAGMFGMYVERVLVPDLQRVGGALERRAAAAGCVRLLTDSQHMLAGDLAPLWPRVLQALISLFELPTDESALPDDHFIEVDDTPGYQAQYAQLTCAKGAAGDPLAGTYLFHYHHHHYEIVLLE
ncbi:hypothetical protein SFRURICE_009680 [Spodoptera frugiperda]|nr:hypothetical protein SFRURICE_009680 [Spodoptera frugiperda]